MSFLGGCMIIPSLWVLMILWHGWRRRMVTFQLSLFIAPWQVGERSFPHGVVWNSWALVRASFFAWEATQAKTQDQLKKRGLKDA